MRFIFILFLCASQSFATTDEFSVYIDAASNNKLDMNSRWSALIRAADFAREDQLNQIRFFSTNKDWYMRNASLIALLKVNPTEALVEAKKLMYDKALVVRSAAVEVVARSLTEEHKKLLAEELNKSYNFHKKSSLWIRKQIVEKLSSSAGIKDRHFFVKSLFDKDGEISHLSAKTLEKITGRRLGDVNFVEKWRTIVKENNWL